MSAENNLQFNAELSVRELEILGHLPDTPEPVSQREIARRTGCSVGLINAVLRKLVSRGYVKVSRMNSRSIVYLLTPSGLSARLVKTYNYVRNTVRTYHAMQARLQELLVDLKTSGITNFYLYGEGEFANLVRVAFEDCVLGELRIGLPQEKVPGAVILNASTDILSENNTRIINLAEELSQVNLSTELKEAADFSGVAL